jgi:uncharacterized protein (TIGR03435 family)
MRPDKDNIEEVLERSFPSASKEQVESARDRIYDRLRSDAAENLPVESIALTPTSRWRWSLVMAMAATLLVVATIWMKAPRIPSGSLQTPEGSIYRPVPSEMIPMQAGKRIEIGDVVRSSDTIDGAIVLADGSRVEMRKESELSVEQAADGIRIRLDHGGLIVKAAKQQMGRHLYVQTRDVTVSVIGTVFFVNAAEEGSRVAVYEGEVRVQQGATETKLGPGEYVSTSPTMPELPLKEAIEWSREAQTHLAALPPRETFEEVSIRPSSGARRPGERGAGANANSLRGCSGGSAVDINPERFAISGKNIYTLTTMAYFGGGNLVQGCLYASFLGLLSGGPGWIQSDAYDIQAVIPAGSFSTPPTIRDPKLQRMVQSLLADRFNLALRREMKEMPVYLMTLREPAKYDASKDSSVWLTKPMAKQGPMAHAWANIENRQGLVAQEDTWIYGANATMSELATLLGRLMGQPVLDRTGFTSKVNFSLETFRDVGDLASPVSAPRNAIEIKSIISEFEKQAGIKLEPSKEKIEVLIIDHIDRPSEN